MKKLTPRKQRERTALDTAFQTKGETDLSQGTVTETGGPQATIEEGTASEETAMTAETDTTDAAITAAVIAGITGGMTGAVTGTAASVASAIMTTTGVAATTMIATAMDETTTTDHTAALPVTIGET